MKSRGYTLIELLVVVAIIAILAAMMAPVLLQAKESARMRCCADNMRQLGQAIWRYMDDHDGFGLPPSPPKYVNPWVFCPEPLCPKYIGQGYASIVNPPDSTSPRIYKILPSQPPKLLWVCPGDLEWSSDRNDLRWKPCWWVFGSSYMYPGPTAYIQARDPADQNNVMAKNNTYPVKPVLWKTPRRNILLADFWCDYHSATRADRTSEPDPNSINPPLFIKLNTVNVLFLDTHMKAVTPEQRAEYQYYTRILDNPYRIAKP